jgi:phosphotransferase system HPr (HPr) family protein
MRDTEIPVVLERETVIPNKEGLHFRPIMQFVDIASRFSAHVTVHCEDRNADGRSPMELLMLMATQGTRIKVAANGADAAEALDALLALVEAGFNED